MVNVLITGGSSGVGEFLARRLMRDPSNQVFLVGRNEEKLESLKHELGISYAIADVVNSSTSNLVIDKVISEFQNIDVLIANAGVGRFKNIEDLTDEDIDMVLNTNVKGVYNYLRPIVKHMRTNNSGQIIVTSSNLGFNVTARGSLYCASKFAVQAIIGSLRKELEGTNIKAATINPGSIDTPWFADYSENPKRHRLDVEDVVDAFMLIINQGNRSNIDHILLNPTYKQ